MTIYIGIGLGVVVLAILAKAAADPQGFARGVVNAADGLAAGAVKGVGALVGVPDTDPTLCAQAMAEGRTWDASKYCPAGTFLSYLASSKGDSASSSSAEPCSCFTAPCDCAGISGLVDQAGYLYTTPAII